MTDRPLGPEVADWTPAKHPCGVSLSGQYAELVPLNAEHDAAGLWAEMAPHPWIWDYLFERPPENSALFRARLERLQKQDDRPCLVIRKKGTTTPLGYACFWTNVPDMGSTEIGNVNLSPVLQNTPAATEAFYLMIDWAFANGYRRMEWKCNALNAPSRRAAQRLGFSYEGVFRNHTIVKGRSRDTAWFAITDKDWPALRAAFQTWLAVANFDAKGQQITPLAQLTAPTLHQSDPSI